MMIDEGYLWSKYSATWWSFTICTCCRFENIVWICEDSDVWGLISKDTLYDNGMLFKQVWSDSNSLPIIVVINNQLGTSIVASVIFTLFFELGQTRGNLEPFWGLLLTRSDRSVHSFGFLSWSTPNILQHEAFNLHT